MQTSEKWSVSVYSHAHINEVNNSTQTLKNWKMKETHHTHPTQRESGPTSLSLLLCLFLSTFFFSSTGFTKTHFSLFTFRVRKCWYRRSLWCYRVTLYSLQQHPYFSFISLPLFLVLSPSFEVSAFLHPFRTLKS